MLGRGDSSSRITRSTSRNNTSFELLPLQWGRSGQELVEQHAQAVDVATRVDVELVQLRLLGTHVFERADHRAEFGVQRLVGQWRAGRLGDAEVDHLGNRLAVVERDQDVRRLQVAVDDSLLVGVLHGLTDRDGQLESLAERQPALVAKPGDGDALDQLHDEVGPAVVGGAGVEDLGDVGVVHQGQRLAFGPEAGEHLPASPCRP